MATIEASLAVVLAADAGVAALAGARVFPAGGRQGATYPYVAWQTISTVPAAHLDGPSSLDQVRVQIDSWDETILGALAMAAAARAAIDGKNSDGGVEFYATFQDQRGPAPDEATRKFGVSQDFFLWYERN